MYPLVFSGDMVRLSFIFSNCFKLVKLTGAVWGEFPFSIFLYKVDANLKGEWRPVGPWRQIFDTYLKSNSNNTLN